jgi:hypothetical protein
MERSTSHFDNLVGRYYPAVYSLAARMTDDPREAVALAREGFRGGILAQGFWIHVFFVVLLRNSLRCYFFYIPGGSVSPCTTANYPRTLRSSRSSSANDQAWNGQPRGVCGASASVISDM